MHDPLLLFSNLNKFNEACKDSPASCKSFKEYFKVLEKSPSNAFANPQERLTLAIAYAGFIFRKTQTDATPENDFAYLENLVPQFLFSSLYTRLFFRTADYYSLTDCKYHGIPFKSDKRKNNWICYASDNDARDEDGIKKDYYIFRDKKGEASKQDTLPKDRDSNFSKKVKYNVSHENGGIIQRAADCKYPNTDLGQLFISSFIPELSKQAVLAKCVSTRNIENNLSTSKNANVTRLKDNVCSFIENLTNNYCIVLSDAFDKSRVNSCDSLLALLKAESRTGILLYLIIVSSILSNNDPKLPENLNLIANNPFLIERITGFDINNYKNTDSSVLISDFEEAKDILRSMHNIAYYVYSQIWDIANENKKISKQKGYYKLGFEEKYGVIEEYSYHLCFEEKYGISSYENLFIHDLEELLRESETPYFPIEVAYNFIHHISTGQMYKITEKPLLSLKSAKKDMIEAIARFTVRYFSNSER